ncbi:MAG: peptide chain release factor N(5)-glutamine methyltransferase, partial [Deltaproteobacteria bacterium]|nr:peptide chain release factor N(5)-glutamine methyltransferase [Deltaproteobacteria bacterium]
MSEAAEIWTVARLLQWTREWLTKQGSATPRLDGELLLAHVL